MDLLLANGPLASSALAWFLAQFSKVIIELVTKRQLSFRAMAASGGMPSSHSATVVALATRVGIESGLQSTAFALALIFAIVVMYDAAGVRRSVSIQARILNRMLAEMMEAQHFNERRLREL